MFYIFCSFTSIFYQFSTYSQVILKPLASYFFLAFFWYPLFNFLFSFISHSCCSISQCPHTFVSSLCFSQNFLMKSSQKFLMKSIFLPFLFCSWLFCLLKHFSYCFIYFNTNCSSLTWEYYHCRSEVISLFVYAILSFISLHWFGSLFS